MPEGNSLYSSLEEKYYSLVERLGPVSGIVERIDRFFPSFLLLIIIILAIAAFFLVPLLLKSTSTELQLRLVNAQGTAIQGSIQLSFAGKTESLQTGAGGEIKKAVPKDSNVEFFAAASGYAALKDTVFVGKENVSLDIVLQAKNKTFDRKIIFALESGERIKGKIIQARLACTNAAVKPEQENISSNNLGEIEFVEPANCGTLILTVTGPAEFKQESFAITEQLTVIPLKFEGLEKGTIELNAVDESGAILEKLVASVSLVKDGSVTQSFQIEHGKGTMEAFPGHYELLVQDSEMQYAMIEKIEIDLNANQKIVVEAKMSNKLKGILRGKVVDLNTGAAIANAKVMLNGLLGDLLASVQTGESGEFKLPLLQSDFLFLSVSADGYLPFEEFVVLDSEEKTIALEKANEFNSGKASVFVLGPDGLGAANAVVTLHYADNLSLAPYGEKITDENGLAEFSGVKGGNYVVFAEKYPYSAQSIPMETKITEAAMFYLWFVPIETSISLGAVDEKGNPVEATTVEVFNAANGEKIDTIEMENGKAFYTTESNKRVFFVFSNPSFLQYSTETFNLSTMDFISVEARMRKQISGEAPRAEFDGVFNDFGERVFDLESGKDYSARIELLVPQEKSFGITGLHFRVGSANNTENDELQITEALGGTAGILSGKFFNEPKSEQTDLAAENTNVFPAKWVIATVERPQAGVYAVALKLRVSEKTGLNSLLPMFYRSWGEENGAYYRYPEDSDLGQAPSITEKQGLYAETIAIMQYFKRPESACYGTICFSISVQDSESKEFLEEPYGVFRGSDYNVFFTITNSGKNSLESFSFSAANASSSGTKNDLKITEFEFDSEKKLFSDYSTEIIQIDSLGAGKNISGKLSVRPLNESYSPLQLRISAKDMNNVSYTVYFDALEKRFMKISSLPQKPVALVENKITFFATDPEMGKGIPATVFKLTLLGADNSESYLQKKTDSNGAAEFIIPAMKPGSVIIVQAFSSKFFARPLELEFGEAPLYFSPARAIVEINTEESIEKKQSFTIVNAISQDISVSSASLVLEQPVFFEEKEMKKFLENFPKEFTAFSEKTSELLLVKLRKNVFIPKNSRFKGSILVNAKSSGIDWVFLLPFEVLVDSNGFSGNTNCISLKEQDWIADVQKNSFYKNLELVNRCAEDGEAINIYDLHAEVSWNSEAMGNIEAVLLDSDGKEKTVVPIAEQGSQILLQEIRTNAKEKIVLRFIPKNGYWGKTADFTVNFSAISPGKQSDTPLYSSNIGGYILLFNPVSCVKIVPHPSEKLKIGERDQNNFFEIDASLCGDVRIEFNLCENDSGCTGGSIEGEVYVSPESFVTTKSNPKRTIKVSRSEIPGEYGVTVSAKVNDVSFSNFAEMLVEIQPEKNEQLYLDKYSFYLNGNNSMDSATITNKKLAEIAKVDASVCDWRDMLQKQERHFNFGDSGGGLAPAEFSGTKETFNKAMATSNAIAQVDSNSIIIAVEATEIAYEKAKKASEDSQEALSKTEDALKLADTMATAVGAVQILITVTQLLEQSSVEGACNGTAAGARMQLIAVSVAGATLNFLAGMIKTDLEEMLKKMSESDSAISVSLSDAEIMRDSAKEGKKELIPNDSTDVSYSGRLAANSFNRARESGKNAISKNKEGVKNFDDAQSMAGTVIAKNVEKASAQTAAVIVAEKLYVSVLQSMTASCEANYICNKGAVCTAARVKAQTFAETTVIAQLAEIGTQLGMVSAAVLKAQGLVLDAMGSADDARQAEIDAVLKLRRAISVSQALSEASFGTSEAQGTDSNVMKKMVSLYPFIGFVGGEMEAGLYSELEKPCDYKINGSIIDYVTDLKSDMEPMQFSVDDIIAYINEDSAKTFGDYNKQAAGIVFQNNGFENEKPAYGLLTIKYRKHEHDFDTEVPLGYKDFGPFRVPDSGVEVIEQKFHVRIVTKPLEQVVLPEKDSETCLQGIKIGKTGQGALPRIKLDWSWDNKKGIAQNECEETNQNYSYCDAAQLNIMLSKKLNALDEWLYANEGKLKCPQNPVENLAKIMIEKMNIRTVEENSIGIEKIAANVRGRDVSVIVSVRNNSGEEKTANVIFSLVAPKGIVLDEDNVTCQRSQKIAPGATVGIDCAFEKLEKSDSYYAVKSYLQPNDSYTELEDSVEFNDEQNIDINSSLSVAFKTEEDTAQKDCWLPNNTGLFDGKSALEYFARDSKIKWTENVKSLEDLAGLLRFNAYLIEDNYNESFAKDFADYYSNIRFFDTPTFFSDAKIGRTLNKYYSGGKILFNNEYFDSTKLQGAGLFAIDINSDFGEKWELFSAQQEPRAVIKPIFSKIAEPFPSSPFYYLPFDSEVGVKGKSLERDNYGAAYEVQGPVIGFNETEFDRMPESADAKALKKVSTIFDQNIETINASALSRGNILSVELPKDKNSNAKIIFSPSYASPAIIRVSAEKQSAFASIVYQLLKSEQVRDAGNSLSYWSGMNGCYDFSGKLAKSEFDYSPDRRAKASDRSLEWKKSYAIDLGAVNKTGNLLLKAIVFTPLDSSFNLKAISPNVKIAGLDNFFGETKELKGIRGMQFNNKESDNYTKTVKDAFAAVENASACISSNGIETSIWWNATALEKQLENGKSVETMEKALEPGKDCLAK